MRLKHLILAIVLLCLASERTALACDETLLDHTLFDQAMHTYLDKLKQNNWEGVKPFGQIKGNRIYLSADFNQLSAAQKRRVLSLLLLDYGEYSPLLHLIDPRHLFKASKQTGSMLPYWVYTSEGRVVSLPYNACNRMTVLTEYERSRLSFLGIKLKRVQRYPMSRWQQENIKKLFWNGIGYDQAGDYWIAWVPEKGRFEIDVPSKNHAQVLNAFWKVAPNYYRYDVLERGTVVYSRFRGKQIDV